MILRWKSYLARTRRSRHPVLAPWHAFAALPEREFAAGAAAYCADLAKPDPGRRINPLVLKAFTNQPPATLAEAAQRYGKLLNDVDRLWQEQIVAAWAGGFLPPLKVPTDLADPDQEELRQVLHGPDTPPNWPLHTIDDLALFPDRPSQGELQKLRKAVDEWRAKGPGAPTRAMVLEDAPVPYQPRVFIRGSPTNLGEPVPRQFLGVLAGNKREPFRHGSGRLELAEAIVDAKNRLTARVLVNRVWLQHFGVGLVRTPSDFGLRSEPPSHPELLDHLATVFMASDSREAPGPAWSIKKLHRLIVLSSIYRQQSGDRPECRKVDPENALVWRMSRRRLDFESTRDALLAVSGRLDRTVGGPPVRDLFASKRRTIYGFLDRLNVPGLYRTFDFPMPDATSPQRDVTTVAPQALFLMNHPFVLDCTRQLLKRPDVPAATETAQRVARLYQLVYGRDPTGAEVQLAHEFLAGERDPAAGWERYAQALLLANEFVFVD